MKRTRMQALNQESARKRIKSAKSNKPFMTALLNRNHRGHREALEHWTRLHEMAFQEPVERPSLVHRGGAVSGGEISPELAPAKNGLARRAGAREGNGQSNTSALERGSARKSAATPRTTISTRSQPSKQRSGAAKTAGAHGPEQPHLPDPEHPLDVDQQAVSPFLRREGETESNWLRRLMAAAGSAQMSAERLTVIREALLQEIGFYDVGSGPAPDDGPFGEAEWRVLAALQNVPIDGWGRAERLDDVRVELEQGDTLGSLEVIGPDGNVYHRPSILGGNPVGDVLQTIDGRIRLLQPPEPGRSVLSILPLVRQTSPSRRGGTPPRSPLVSNVAPRVHQFIRSRRGTTAIGLGIGTAIGTALQRRDRSDMDQAPDLPPVPGLEPPEEPDTDESFDEASIDVEVVPGLIIPEPDGPKVLIFPDVSEEILRTLIIERRERQETKDQIDAIRDFYLDLYADWSHHAGGRPVGSENDKQEFRLPGPGVAFRHPVTGRPGDSRPGSIYVDLTFKTPNGFVHVQSVDIDRDGLPTERELRTARRLADLTRQPVYLVPKTWQVRDLERRDSDFIPIEVR